MAEGGSIVDIEWSCPSCTYINKPGSFKCSVCGTPKGTATRQMKFQHSALEQQYVAESIQASRAQSSRALNRMHIQHQASSSLSLANQPAPATSSNSPSSVSQPTSTNSGSPTHSLPGEAIKRRHRLRINPLQTTSSTSSTSAPSKTQQKSKWPRLRNIDRSRIINSQTITVNRVTVTITEYPLLYPDSE